MAGTDQCGFADGGGALGIKLASVEDGEDLDRLGDAIHQEVVRMNHRLAGPGQPSGAVDIGMIRQVLGGMHDRGAEPLRSREVTRADVLENIQQIVCRLVRPDERQHHRGLCLSRIACIIAIT